MTRARHRLILTVVLVSACAMLARGSEAAEVFIDDFNVATAGVTGYPVSVPVPLNPIPPDPPVSTTQSESGVPGVLGGTRTLTVEATKIAIPGLDTVHAGGGFLGSFFIYDSTVTSDGRVSLLYDAGGVLPGLNASFPTNNGIRVVILEADPASVPYAVTVTLTDTALNSASQTRIVTTPGPLDVDFALATFGVDLTSIYSVQLDVDPNEAGDMFFQLFKVFLPETAGGCDNGVDDDNNGLVDCQDPACAGKIECMGTAPLLSPWMLAALILMLGSVGAMGLRAARIRR